MFLDADADPLAITEQFQRLKNLALKNGVAVGIGHPFATTLDVLERELPELEAQGFLLVSIASVIAERSVGVVVVPAPPAESTSRAKAVRLLRRTHHWERPVLFARGSHPYRDVVTPARAT